jgi:hypothetical protein
MGGAFLLSEWVSERVSEWVGWFVAVEDSAILQVAPLYNVTAHRAHGTILMIMRAVVVLHVSFIHICWTFDDSWVPFFGGGGEGWNGSLKSREPDISSLEHSIILKRLADQEKYTQIKNNPAPRSKDHGLGFMERLHGTYIWLSNPFVCVWSSTRRFSHIWL